MRQGDPLSPYLFILCAEALCSLIRKAESDGCFSGIPISKRGTRITQLFFADDCLLFCKANGREWKCIQDIFFSYEAASGQKINKEKTTIFFSKNTKQEVGEVLIQEAGVNSIQHFEKYLGLPALIGCSWVSSFNSIKGKIWTRLNGWKEKLLTHAGKDILLRTVFFFL